MTVAGPFNMSCISFHTQEAFILYCAMSNILRATFKGNYFSYYIFHLKFHKEPIWEGIFICESNYRRMLYNNE